MIQHEFEEEKNIPPTEYIQFMTQIIAHTHVTGAHTSTKKQSMGSFMLVKLSVLGAGFLSLHLAAPPTPSPQTNASCAQLSSWSWTEHHLPSVTHLEQ